MNTQLEILICTRLTLPFDSVVREYLLVILFYKKAKIRYSPTGNRTLAFRGLSFDKRTAMVVRSILANDDRLSNLRSSPLDYWRYLDWVGIKFIYSTFAHRGSRRPSGIIDRL